jgi:phospho-N-acetylmuramoyl-pentapeptide-transferase
MPDLPHTLRPLCGACLAYVAVTALGPWAIHRLRRLCRERIDTASAKLASLHAAKSGTPSMGGLLIFGCWFAAVGVCCDLTQRTVWIALLTTLGLAVLGACDDLTKRRGRRGLSVLAKLAGQVSIALPAGVALAAERDGEGAIFALLYIALAVLLITGMSNAVNLTDGLDGLAAGCGAIAATTLAAAACALSAIDHTNAAKDWQVALLALYLAAALAGFLRFNRLPAQVFMGDTGSLPLGGLLAVLALSLRSEWLLLLIGGVFVCELASVVIQLAWFRRTGRRVFRCAPLHHHFEFLGWPERVIVLRFWAAAGAMAGAGLLCLGCWI